MSDEGDESCVDESELIRFASGKLEAARRQVILDHLARCESCRRLVAFIAAEEPDSKPTNDGANVATKRLLEQVLDMRTLAIAALVLLGACKSSTTPPPPAVDPTATVRFVTPPVDGAVSTIMLSQLEKAKAEKRRVLLYAGAPWCEPCRAFHEAVDRGELTGKVGPLDLVAFDSQMDAERMLLSNYESQFIPLFALPGADGKGTGKHIEGSVKGSGAVADIVPRLTALLAQQVP